MKPSLFSGPQTSREVTLAEFQAQTDGEFEDTLPSRVKIAVEVTIAVGMILVVAVVMTVLA
jgi:hypothetical protein